MNYVDLNKQPLEFLPLSGLLDDELTLRESFYYFDQQTGEYILCEAGKYDGFSIPKWVQFLTRNVLRPIMPVVESTIPHDAVCARDQLTRKQRRVLFKNAYDDAVKQFYGGVYPDQRRDWLVKGVHAGSKYFKQC